MHELTYHYWGKINLNKHHIITPDINLRGQETNPHQSCIQPFFKTNNTTNKIKRSEKNSIQRKVTYPEMASSPKEVLILLQALIQTAIGSLLLSNLPNLTQNAVHCLNREELLPRGNLALCIPLKVTDNYTN